MSWRLGLVALLLASGAAFAQSPAVLVPEGTPQPGDELLDRDFGVGTDLFGLDRKVEMYQWHRVDASHYEQVWKAAWIDSSGFSAGHANPPEIPLDSHRWWSPGATLDGKPLDQSVLKALGQWQEFRPSFSRLPGNLAATFQPEGDGLISSQNPLDPQIGDLRIRWRELGLPPLAGKIELRDGRWQLVPGGSALSRTASASPGVDTIVAARGKDNATWWPWLLGVLAIFLAAVAWLRNRR